jgi:hypothetical protein
MLPFFTQRAGELCVVVLIDRKIGPITDNSTPWVNKIPEVFCIPMFTCSIVLVFSMVFPDVDSFLRHMYWVYTKT